MLSHRAALFVASVVSGAMCSVAVLAWLSPHANSTHAHAAGTFAVLVVIGQILTYKLAHKSAGSIAFFPALALCAISPHWSAVAAIAGAEVIAEGVRRRAAIKSTFNIAQHSLTAAIAILVYLAAGGESLLTATGHPVVPFLAMSLTYFAVNSLLVSGVIAASERGKVWDVWKKNNSSSLIYDFFTVPFIYIFAHSYVLLGSLGPALLAVPLLGVRELYQKNEKLNQVNRELLELMVAAIEARDPYTSGHSRRVAENALIIGRAIGLGPRALERLQVAALLHDVGKIFEIYAPILQKPARLTEEERLIMETHPLRSADLVAKVSHFGDVVTPIRHHHENWDGTGYPSQLAGESIPLASRVIMIADTIDAMMTDRPYRLALSAERVAVELIRMSGVQFDPVIVDKVLNNPVARRQLLGRTTAVTGPIAERSPLTFGSKRRLRIEAS